MNNQEKSGEMGKKISSHLAEIEPVESSDPTKRKRGRPKTSPHDTATQNRIRVQRHRQAMKEDDAVRADIYLPKAWHDWLVGEKNANLREVAVEAFALWLKKNGYPADVTAKPNSLNDA